MYTDAQNDNSLNSYLLTSPPLNARTSNLIRLPSGIFVFRVPSSTKLGALGILFGGITLFCLGIFLSFTSPDFLGFYLTISFFGLLLICFGIHLTNKCGNLVEINLTKKTLVSKSNDLNAKIEEIRGLQLIKLKAVDGYSETTFYELNVVLAKNRRKNLLVWHSTYNKDDITKLAEILNTTVTESETKEDWSGF